VYGGATALRRRAYAASLLRSRRVPVPVVVVGNIAVGGTGKTPLTIALAERLRSEGWTPGVASRGYGRRDEASARWVEADTDPSEGGDEPVLIAHRAGVKVRVDRNRVAAAEALVDAGCDIVVCDDGLQHYRLARDIEIEVIDGRRRYGNGRLLPAGPLREPPERASRCDFRVVNGGGSGEVEAGFGEWLMQLRAGDAQPLQGGRPRPLSAFAGQRVHAVAGIGHPERFFAMLRAHDIAVVPHAFGDHQRYSADDFRFGSDLPVLMTEKDAVKCMAFAGPGTYSVPVHAVLPEGFWVGLLDRLPKPR
jgi:tetraacyldisaccharide 4'-kinase